MVAERGEPCARLRRQSAVALDTDHLAGETRQHGGLIARSGADLEHPMMRPQRQLLGHIGDHVRLADGLPARDRQRLVGIGGFDKAGFDEIGARHLLHRPQHRLVADAAPAQRQQELHTADIASALLAHGQYPLTLKSSIIGPTSDKLAGEDGTRWNFSHHRALAYRGSHL